MNNDYDFFEQDRAMQECEQHHALCRAAELIDELGTERFLFDVMSLTNNPKETHILGQLYGVMQHHESLVLKMKPLSNILDGEEQL